MFKKLSYLLKFKPKHHLFHLSFSFSMKLEFDGRDFISDPLDIKSDLAEPPHRKTRNGRFGQGADDA